MAKKKKNRKKTYTNPDTIFHHAAQDEAVAILLKRNYTQVDNNPAMGAILKRIGTDGFVEQVAVDINGRVRRYKAWRPSTFETARLNKTHK